MHVLLPEMSINRLVRSSLTAQVFNLKYLFGFFFKYSIPLCVVFCLTCQYLIWELWIRITSSEYFVHFVSGSVRPVHSFDKIGVFDHFVDAFLLKGFVWSVTPFDLPWLIWILETLYCLLGLWINLYCWNHYKSYFFPSYPKKKREKGWEWKRKLLCISNDDFSLHFF